MLLALGFGALGLIIGPWLGIIVDRLYSREVFAPTHRCQVCRSDLTGHPLVPVLSWAGRCRVDAGHRWWRYPLLDLSTAATFTAVAYHVGWAWQLGPYVAAFAVLVMVSVFDLETHLLPNVVTIPLLGAVATAVLLLSTPFGWADAIVPAFVGGGFYWVLLYVVHLIYPAGMGLGDVKLVPTLGLLLGWMTISAADAVVLVFWAFALGNLIGALTGLAFRALGVTPAVSGGPSWFDDDELGDDDEAALFDVEVPFGPFLVLATLIVILLSSRII